MEAYNVLIGQIGRGQLVDEATRALVEITEAITDPELKSGECFGELTLKLKISLERDTGAVKVTPELLIKKPRHPLDRALFFITPEGNWVRENPRQSRLFEDVKVEPIERKK